jgi:hypothetical protein
VLLLSQHVETNHAMELVTLGGFGYLLVRPLPRAPKHSAPTRLRTASKRRLGARYRR